MIINERDKIVQLIFEPSIDLPLQCFYWFALDAKQASVITSLEHVYQVGEFANGNRTLTINALAKPYLVYWALQPE